MSLDVVDLLNRYGLPIAALAVVVIFVWKGLWPFLMKNMEATRKLLEDQLASAQEERKAAMREFTAAIARRDDLAAHAAKTHADALNAMTSEIRRLSADKAAPRGRK